MLKWKHLWKIIAERFDLETLPYQGEGFSLDEAMTDKGLVWDAIVRENKLYSTKIEEVGNWWFANSVLNKRLDSFLSMNKSKEYGFLGFQNTELL